MIEKEKIEAYKASLEETKAKIEEELKNLKKSTDFGSDTVDPDEETDETEEMSNVLGIEATLKGRLGNINKALTKVGSGIYGKCEKCGNEIEEEILKIAPESQICKTCKQSK